MKRIFSLFSAALLFSGCGLFDPASQKGNSQTDTAWRSDGVVAISRSVPVPSASGGAPMLGFAPTQLRAGPTVWLAVNKAERKLVIMDGASVVTAVTGDGIDQLSSGSYKVVHKQRSPLWYAPDQYFESRLLSSPPENHPERYRRGALGDFAVFLDGDVAIHSGALWTPDVGGIRLTESDMAKLYYSIAVGSSLEVQ